jgi:hypothetical protein
MKDNTYRHLADVGVFTNTFRELVIEQNVLPWMDLMVQGFVDELNMRDLCPDEVLYEHMTTVNDTHSMIVVEEQIRKELVKRENAKLEQLRLD